MKLNQVGGLQMLKDIRVRCPDLPALIVTRFRKEMEIAIQATSEINAYA